MDSNQRAANGQGGRVQWGSYGFIAGVVLGLFMGWMFAGFVGAFVRVALVAVIIVPAVLLFLGWRRYIAPWLRPSEKPQYVGPAGAIETRAVVREMAHEARSR